MALPKLNSTQQAYIIGHNKYSYNGREGLYLNLVEDYEEGNKDQVGSFQSAVAAPYDEHTKLTGISMSVSEPAVIEFVGRRVNRQGNTVLVCDEIVKITPFKAVSVSSSAK